MKQNNYNIIIFEKSPLLQWGLKAVLTNILKNVSFIDVDSLKEIEQNISSKRIDFVFINSNLVINQLSLLKKLKKENPDVIFMSVVANLVENEILNIFDEHISITDTNEELVRKIKEISTREKGRKELNSSSLSDREIEVLKYLVKGYSNKEIAKTLSISTNTVITHRKNITQKTGIKSLAGLTIFAVVNNYVKIDNV